MNLHKFNEQNEATLRQIRSNTEAINSIIETLNPHEDPRRAEKLGSGSDMKSEPIGIMGELDKQSSFLAYAAENQAESLKILHGILFATQEQELKLSSIPVKGSQGSGNYTVKGSSV